MKNFLSRASEIISNNRRLIGGFVLLLVIGAGVGIFIVATDTPEYVPPEVVRPNEGPDKSKALPEGGAEGRAGGILVTPSFQEKEVTVGSSIDPISVTNRSPIPVKIIVNYVPLSGNSLIGKPEYRVSPETIRLGKKMVRPDATEFRLLPNATRKVEAKVVGEPEDSIGMYGMMTFAIDDEKESPVSEEFKDGVRLQVNQRTRIGAIVLLRFPGKIEESARIEKISAVEEEGEIQVKTRVINTGNYIVRPIGTVVVSSNETGDVVSSEQIVPRQGIVPGDNRDLIIAEGLQGLPPGDYTITTRVEAGGRARSAASAFRIDQNGNLPTPDAEYIVQIRPGVIRTDQNFSAFVQLRNTGTRDFAPEGVASFYRYGSEKTIIKDRFGMDAVAPGELTQTSLDFPGQPEEGNYEVLVEMFSDDGIDLGQRAASVLISSGEKKEISLWNKARDWLSDNPIGGVLIGILVVGLVMGLLLVLSERRRKNYS